MGAESPKDECGLFGIWAPGDEVARLTYFGLFAQQHRGQESAGMAVSDGHNILVFQEMGLVSQVIRQEPGTTPGDVLAIGDTRFPSADAATLGNLQSVFKGVGT